MKLIKCTPILKGLNFCKVKRTICFLFFISSISSHEIRAQIFEPTGNSHNVGVNFGFDNNLISLNLGYAYYTSKYKTSAFIEFTQGSSLIGTGDFKTQIGLQSWLGSFKKFTWRNSIAFVFARSVNKAGNYTGLGINIISNPGFKFNRFGIGADLQYNPFLATHIKHSDYYRHYHYENVKNGWYSLTAQNLRAGLYVAAQIGKQRTLELNMKAGYQNNGQYDKLVPNAYAIFGVNKSF
jgi:hypothetical protein